MVFVNTLGWARGGAGLCVPIPSLHRRRDPAVPSGPPSRLQSQHITQRFCLFWKVGTGTVPHVLTGLHKEHMRQVLAAPELGEGCGPGAEGPGEAVRAKSEGAARPRSLRVGAASFPGGRGAGPRRGLPAAAPLLARPAL